MGKGSCQALFPVLLGRQRLLVLVICAFVRTSASVHIGVHRLLLQKWRLDRDSARMWSEPEHFDDVDSSNHDEKLAYSVARESVRAQVLSH